ncbi:MAG: hypothetical protein Q7T86_16595 [Hyphomicrobiaceae bacterium]|nr:hypothetical protein [Hyphomicrobiaceae bacterium]
MKRLTPVALLFAWTLPLAGHALAETTAVIAICPKGQKVCNKDTARSVYRIPLEGSICFVPIQQKLAELGVYDESQDALRISCELKSPAG